MKKNILCIVVVLIILQSHAQNFISTTKTAGDFTVATPTAAASILIDSNDDWLVQKSARLLQNDIKAVTGQTAVIANHINNHGISAIVIGTINGSPIIQSLIASGKLNVDSIKNKWETFKLQVIDNPMPGIDKALVIVGSDKRGAAYGVFELSRQIGVSPWYWWADVPVKKQQELYVKHGAYKYGPPSVQYRGIFINDEAPAFSGWTKEKFGGVNHLVYEKMFELLLRLKANYLWPAMWGNAFNDDDTLNPVLADKYGIVMGTTHHEPMLRAQQEWKRYGKGVWNYQTNDSVLRNFWRKGIQHMGSHESIVSVGMRGDGDMPMTEGSNIALLEKIVHDQRAIIEEVTGKPAAETPQLWALYKEVQDYYDKGMRVPDDVTLLLCDDNWGNIRKLPKLTDKSRKGGYGIYYHFDYVGDPRNYKWLNTNNITRVWEQMNLAKQYGADKIWVVNVGDLKPMEYPISFFLDFAWNTNAWRVDNIASYAVTWAEQQFGKQYAKDIGDILTKYSDYNARRKPELLAPNTYNLVNYNEAETVVEEYATLVEKAENIYDKLPAEYKDAYYQLVLFPVKACANLNALFVATGKNRLYAVQGRALTNVMADSVQVLFAQDSILAHYYNKVLAGGKWDHMMDQTHISYTYWQQPMQDTAPVTERIMLHSLPSMGVSVEGSDKWWTNSTSKAVLPVFNKYVAERHYIDIFNSGQQQLSYTIKAGKPWFKISSTKGVIQKQERIWIEPDWKGAPHGIFEVPITIQAGNNSIEITAVVNNVDLSKPSQKSFIEYNGYVSINADDYSRAFSMKGLQWKIIPNIGRTGNGLGVFPLGRALTPGIGSTHTEYDIYLSDTGNITASAYFSPSLDFNNEGMYYAISLDDETPQPINIATNTKQLWPGWVADNININQSTHYVHKAGWHVLKYWYGSPGVILQKIVLDAGGLKPSYLGPPETKMK